MHMKIGEETTAFKSFATRHWRWLKAGDEADIRARVLGDRERGDVGLGWREEMGRVGHLGWKKKERKKEMEKRATGWEREEAEPR